MRIFGAMVNLVAHRLTNEACSQCLTWQSPFVFTQVQTRLCLDAPILDGRLHQDSPELSFPEACSLAVGSVAERKENQSVGPALVSLCALEKRSGLCGCV